MTTSADQTYRTLLASIDMLVATITSNGVVLSSLLQDKGHKKLKYKVTPGRRPSEFGKRALKHRWGSDEDLMRLDRSDSGWISRGGSETGVPDQGPINSEFELATLSTELQSPQPAMLREAVTQHSWDEEEGPHHRNKVGIKDE